MARSRSGMPRSIQVGVPAGWLAVRMLMDGLLVAGHGLATTAPRQLLEHLGRIWNRSPHDGRVGLPGQGRIAVAVDGHDRLGRLHPGPVLDGAADADGNVQLRCDRLAGLADLNRRGYQPASTAAREASRLLRGRRRRAPATRIEVLGRAKP